MSFTFNPTATGFDLLNALRLAQASELAYKSSQEIEATILEEWEFQKYRFFEKDETQAFLATNKEIIIFAFRGTSTNKDWLTDLKVKLIPGITGKIHCGFNEALDCIWDEMFEVFWKEFESPAKTIWLTGHSLGGALATLAANRLIEKVSPLAGLYTFGQPCVGDRKFSDYFMRELKGKSFRFVHEEDLVPQLLPVFGYCHMGQEYFIDRNGKISATNNFWNWCKSVSESVFIRSSPHAARLRYQNPGGVGDHNMNLYIKAIENLVKNKKASFVDYMNG